MDRRGWNERHGDPDRDHLARPNRFLVEVVADNLPGTAIDLAAGRGRNALWLAEQGWSVTAVDWSDVGLAFARAGAAERGVALQLVHADLVTWEPELRYDLVLIAYLHVPEELRRSIWEKAVASVAPGGRLVVISHDPENLVSGHGGPQEPSVLFTADEVVGVVGHELVIERAERVDRPIDGTDDHAVDNVVVARRPR